jgi:hypothetical protein
MTAAVGTLLQPSYSKANPSPDTPESLVRVISNTDPAFDALFSATFPQIDVGLKQPGRSDDAEIS